MTAPRVLVVHASRNGGTAAIAEWIGETLRGEGLDVDVLPAPEVEALDPYSAVVLGSGLYAGRWLRDAVRFARRHRTALVGLPVWLFSSGPLDSSAAEREIPPARGVARIIDGLDARGHATFGGRLVPGARGFIARIILSQNRGGDYRDRAQIQDWALGIAHELAVKPSSV